MGLAPKVPACLIETAQGLVRFLLPAVCPLCWEAPAADCGLCAGCLEAAAPEPLWREAGGPLAEVGSALPYGGQAEEMIKGLKYEGRLSMAAPLGHLLALAVDEGARSCELIAPVPLHPKRLAGRGFNQSLLLARELAGQAKLAGRLLPRLLVRTRHTRPQVELSGAERADNVRGAFALGGASPPLEGRSVLLIDDVLTTGSTLGECAAVLREAGAARVVALTVARAGA
jgi:ComF family protein